MRWTLIRKKPRTTCLQACTSPRHSFPPRASLPSPQTALDVGASTVDKGNTGKSVILIVSKGCVRWLAELWNLSSQNFLAQFTVDIASWQLDLDLWLSHTEKPGTSHTWWLSQCCFRNLCLLSLLSLKRGRGEKERITKIFCNYKNCLKQL